MPRRTRADGGAWRARQGDGRDGQVSLLTPELADSLVLGVRQRKLFDSQNAIANGVHPTTLKRWIEQGLSENAVEPYRSFAMRYAKELVADEEEAVGEVRAGALPFQGDDKFHKPGDWKAAAWYLRYRYPTRWGDASRVPKEGLDIEEILNDVHQKPELLKELFANPPQELIDAVKANRAAFEALLDTTAEEPEIEAPPALPEQ